MMGLERAKRTYAPALFVAALPNMKYIHVTRHGLDMAHSSNQTNLRYGGLIFLGAL